VLFVEAKALGKDLTDSKWVAQTINYANNQGVVWCALTDGLRYLVFKTNEPVDMSQKLLFEVDLTDTTDEDERPGVLRRLSLLSRDAIDRGELDALGTRLFDDSRIRTTLEELFTSPPSRFVRLIRDLLPDVGRNLSPSQIEDSLRRVGRSFLRSETRSVETVPSVAPKETGPSSPTKRRTYSYEHHFGDKPQIITDLYQQLHERITGLGEDIDRVYRAQYIGYRIGRKTICSVIPQKVRLRLVLPLDPQPLATDPFVRDISEVGHWGVGDMEVTVATEEQLDRVSAWVHQAADEARG